MNGGHVECLGDRRRSYRIVVGFLRERDHLEEPGVVGRIIVKGVFTSWMGAWTGNFLTSSGPVSYSGRTLFYGMSDIVHRRAGITNWPKQQGECTQNTPDVARAIWFRLLIRESLKNIYI